MRYRILPVSALLFTLFLTTPCFAHKVRIFAWGEGDTIHTESKFSGGRSARGAVVQVVDSATGKEILTGETDDSGLFDFKQPADSTSFDIIINSGDGHKNSWHYDAEPSPAVTAAPTAKHSETDVKTEPEKTTPTAPAVVSAGITKEELAQIIDARLEAKLAPIRRMLAEREDKGPSIQDILGGIGYILGLAGLAAYMKSKPGKRD